MNVAGERSFAAPREDVWVVLNDPASMAQTIPGVDSFDVQDDKHWSAKVKIPLSLGALQMTMKMEKTEERRPEFAKLAIKGSGVGAMLNMTTAFTLSDAGGATRMDWEADVHIAGPVGSMGQRVLQPIVNQQVEHVLSALDKQVMARAESPETSGPKDYGAPAQSSSDTEPPAGSSGAEQGVAPLAPESYEPEPEGPTTSTES